MQWRKPSAQQSQINVGLHFVQHQPTIFHPTYGMHTAIKKCGQKCGCPRWPPNQLRLAYHSHPEPVELRWVTASQRGSMEHIGSCNPRAVASFHFRRLAQSAAKPNRQVLLRQPERDKHGCGSSVKQIPVTFLGKRWASLRSAPTYFLAQHAD